MGAYVLTLMYSIIMMLLTVAIIVAGVECSFNMTAIFLMFMAGIHILAGIIHFDLVTLLCGLGMIKKLPNLQFLNSFFIMKKSTGWPYPRVLSSCRFIWLQI